MSDPFEKFKKQLFATKRTELVAEEDEKENLQPNEIIEEAINQTDGFFNVGINLPEVDPPPNFDGKQEEIKEETKQDPVVLIPTKLDYVFMPNHSITVLDLARILAFTQLSISKDLYDQLPPNLQQYFAKFDDKTT